MSGPRLDWKGTGRYDWRAWWEISVAGERRLLIVKLLIKGSDGKVKAKIVATR